MAKKFTDNDYSGLLTGGDKDVERDIDTSLQAYDNLKGLYGTTIGRLVRGFDKAKSTKSIIGMAARNTFEFPVFISKSIPLDYATATNQLLEQLYASYVQAAISQNPIVDARSVKHGGFLANLQTNTTKYVEYTDMIYAHEACHNEIINEGYEFVFDMLNCADCDSKAILENVDNTPLCEFEHFFVEGGGTARDAKAQLDIEDTDDEGNEPADANSRRNYRKEVHDRRDEQDYKARNSKLDNESKRIDLENTNSSGDEPDDANDRTDARKFVHNKRAEQRWKAYNAAADSEIKTFDVATQKQKETDRRDEHAMKMMNRAPEVLKEDDMRKINTMKPLMFKIQMRVVNNKDEISEKPVEFVVGVHTHAHLIDADVLPDVVKYPLKEMNEITRRIKWKNGELKFMKDIVFQIKEKKQTAIDSRDPKKKWYRRLYELAHEKGDTKVSGAITGNGSTGLIPNATIMMSASDCDNVKAQTKLDVMKPSLAKRLCNELFLIALVVIDQDAESIKLFIPELYNDWEVHSLASVEKQLAELSTAGSKTRDLFKLLK